MTSEDRLNRPTAQSPHPGGEDDFLRRLESFPNLFFQKCAKKATKDRLKAILRAIEEKQQRRAKDDPIDLQDEENPKNIVTFLQWTLGHVQEAEVMAAREVSERPSNILALSNSAFVLLKKGMVDEAWEQLKTLDALRAGDSQQYCNLKMEAQSEILYLYIKLQSLFRPYALSSLQKKLLSKRPHDDRLKYTLGLTLRCYTHPSSTSRHPEMDFAPAVRRAIELFEQILEREENSSDLRAKAAAELGEILSQQKDKHIKKAMEEEQRRLGLTAAQCFDKAVRLSPENPAVLVRVGRYFRRQGNFDKAKELLQKAIDIRPETAAHSDLGITLKELAFKQVSFRRQAPVNVNTPSLSRDGKYVQEAIEHFCKAIELTNGENYPALYDLTLIHYALGEYDEALQEILQIFQLRVINFNQAMAQAGLTFAKIAKGETDDQQRETLQEMSQFCLNLSLSNQCRQLFQGPRTTRINEAFWFSFHSLQKNLRRQGYKQLRENTGTEEGNLLKTMKTCSETLPVLKDIIDYSEEQAVDASVLERAVQDYLTKGRYDDALLFLSLLKLTQQRHVLEMWRDADVYVKVHVLVAEDRLLRCVRGTDVVTDINITAAKIMFQQAFQDVFSPGSKLTAALIPEGSCEGRAGAVQNDGCRGDKRSDEGEKPRYCHDSLPRTTSPSQAAINHGEADDDDTASPELDDDVNDELQVLLLHDPRDEEIDRDARNVQTVLQEICGLKTALMCDAAPLAACRSALVDSVTQAELLVFVVRSADISPEFSAWIQEAVNTTTAGGQVGLSHRPNSPASPQRLVTLVLNSSPLPPALQGHRFFPASSSELQEMGQCHESRSEDGVRAACKLFCGLIGLHM